MESSEYIKREILTAMRESPDIRKQMRDEVLAVAQKGAAFARSIAPVGGVREPDPFAGTFRDSIHAEEITKGRSGKLPAARIVSEDPAAVSIEYGTAKTPEHHTFADTEVAMSGEGTDTTKPYWTTQTDVDPSLRQR